MKKILKTTLALVAVCAFVASASAVTWVQGAGGWWTSPDTLTAGGLTFSDFRISGAIVGAGGPAVTLMAEEDSGTINLWLNGSFLAGSGQNLNSDFWYTVSGWPIHEIDQALNPSFQGTGGTVAIGETVWSGGYGSGQVAQSTVGFISGSGSDYEDPPGEVVQFDSLTISGNYGALYVTKDIAYQANIDGAAGATGIKQSFHNGVPDGGLTIGLLGFALMGLEALRRKLS